MSGQINLTNRLSRRFDPGDPTATGSGPESMPGAAADRHGQQTLT